MGSQAKHDPWGGVNEKIKKYYPGPVGGQVFVHFGPKSYNVMWGHLQKDR